MCEAAETRRTGVRDPLPGPCRQDWMGADAFWPTWACRPMRAGTRRRPCEDKAGRPGSLLAGLVTGVTACGAQGLWLPPAPITGPPSTAVALPVPNYGTPCMAGPSGAWGGL